MNDDGKRENAYAEEPISKYAKESIANIIVQPQDIGNKKLMPVKEEEPPPYTAAPVPSPPVPAAPQSKEEWQIELVKAKAAADKAKQDKAEKAKQDKVEAEKAKQKAADLKTKQKEFWECKGMDGKKDEQTLQKKKKLLKELRVRKEGYPT